MRERVCRIDAAHPIINSVQLPKEGVNRTGCQSAGALTQFPITCLRVNYSSACPISTKRKFNNILGWTWRYGLQGGKGDKETNQLSLQGGLLSVIGFSTGQGPNSTKWLLTAVMSRSGSEIEGTGVPVEVPHTWQKLALRSFGYRHTAHRRTAFQGHKTFRT